MNILYIHTIEINWQMKNIIPAMAMICQNILNTLANKQNDVLSSNPSVTTVAESMMQKNADLIMLISLYKICGRKLPDVRPER